MTHRAHWLLVAALLSWSGLAQAWSLDEPLNGSSTGQVQGGSFSADGWTTTGGEDAIIYAVPRLSSGWAQFTVTGLTVDKLNDVDHELFSMYDAFELSEPIPYSPQFRNNDYKMVLRIYGQLEPSRTGAQKLLYSLCPDGGQVYSDGAPCPCPNYFNEEPFGGDQSWSGAPETIRIEWTATSAKYLRNGQEVHALDWSSTGFAWGPREQHVMIGCPRNTIDTVAMPVGVTFSSFHIEGEEGPEGPVCSGGTGGAAGAAGSGGEGGQAGSSEGPDAAAGSAGAAGATDAAVSDATADTSAVSDASSNDASAGAGGSWPASEDDGGCGCRVPRSPRGLVYGSVAALIALCAMRRRSRSPKP